MITKQEMHKVFMKFGEYEIVAKLSNMPTQKFF